MKIDRSDRPALYLLGLLGALKALGLVLVAEGVARGVVATIAGDHWLPGAQLIVAGGLLRALVGWATRVAAARAAIGTKERLRGRLADHVLISGGGRPSTAVVGTLGLDDLDHWYGTVLPAIAATATVPLLVGVRILSADWVSALIVVLTVPLVPVFMALVGMYTQERSDAAAGTLQRLGDHLAELARGLPVIVGLGRVEEQSAALRRISEDHRTTTSQTLRTAFLSSLVLELIATISVAVVAVFVGLRLLNGDLPLYVGLVALVLAPECFAPFRELGAAFHAAQDGLAARRRVEAVVGEPTQRVEPVETLSVAHSVSTSSTRSAPTLVALRRATAHGVGPVSFTLHPRATTSLDGPSGSGKSTVLGMLAGTVALEGGEATRASSVAYVPQHPHTVGDTVAEELSFYAGPNGPGDVLARLGLDGLEGSDPAQLSPGELRRLAVARALLRVEDGAELLLLDEPTAHLDPHSAALVEAQLAALHGRVTMVIAAHEAGVAALATHHVSLGRSMRRTVAAVVEPPQLPQRVELVETPALTPEVSTGSTRSTPWLPTLRTFLAPAAWRFVFAALLGVAAALFAIALTGVSAWLIVRASDAEAIMYLLVAIVGVRFFGVGRASLRYAERLVTHDAVLVSLTELRMRLWAGLASRGLASRALARGGVALDHLVGAADRVRDLVPRAVLPVLVAIGTSVAAVIAVLLLAPAFTPTLVIALLVALLVAPAAALLGDHAATRDRDAVRSAALRRFVGLVGAAGDLQANGVGGRVRADLADLDARAAGRSRRSALALGLGDAVVTVALSIAAALALGVPADGPITAVLVLLPIALVEPLSAHVGAVQLWPALRAALRKVAAVSPVQPHRVERPRRVELVETPTQPVSTGSTRCLSTPARIDRIDTLELRDLGAAWSTESVFEHVQASVARGDWLVVEGPSGSGKSTLLATLLGYLAPSSGAVLVDGVDSRALDAGAMRDRIAWCPQEAHIFDSTVRGNLALGRRATDEEYREVLDRVGLVGVGLDRRVGSEGSRLSGGQRQRLAVARTLLTHADVVLLDEPTAHLDSEAAENLVADLRRALADRIVVLVTHHASEVRPGDVRVTLGPVATQATASISG